MSNNNIYRNHWGPQSLHVPKTSGGSSFQGIKVDEKDADELRNLWNERLKASESSGGNVDNSSAKKPDLKLNVEDMSSGNTESVSSDYDSNSITSDSEYDGSTSSTDANGSINNNEQNKSFYDSNSITSGSDDEFNGSTSSMINKFLSFYWYQE